MSVERRPQTIRMGKRRAANDILMPIAYALMAITTMLILLAYSLMFVYSQLFPMPSVSASAQSPPPQVKPDLQSHDSTLAVPHSAPLGGVGTPP